VPDIIGQGADLDLIFGVDGSDDIGFPGVSQIDDNPAQPDRPSLLQQKLALGFQRGHQLELGNNSGSFQHFADKQIIARNFSFAKSTHNLMDLIAYRFKDRFHRMV
jgi:hypothetical protein